jgi:DNA polymerase-4
MLAREADGTKFRLLGVGLSEFSDARLADPVDLVDGGAAKRAKAEAAVDSIRDRFGDRAVELGLVFEPRRSGAPKR